MSIDRGSGPTGAGAMGSDPETGNAGQLLDGSEILTCTFATMELLQAAVAAELGEDDAERYGLVRRRPVLALMPSRSRRPAPSGSQSLAE